ncbi:MAG: hypothetical protein J6C26_06420 [Clostridia bacterium]|nr:hypothetical protein [Clostridia bacterium]MBQ4323713.1 hypothetical protein [Clostridia bacterium]
MLINENEYEVRKKYCPSLRKNVIIKVYYGAAHTEECTERSVCEGQGGCTNRYLHSDSASHSL